MASSSSVQLSSPLPRLALVALASIAATSSSIFAAQAFRRRRQRLELRNHAEQSSGAGSAAFASHESAGAQPQTPSAGRTGKGKRKTSEVIIREALARNYVYFGEEGMKSIRESFVIIVGLGGVGSAVATMLVRSGVGRVRLIDFDQVSLSSLNRHSTATLASVGTPKVTACRDYYASIAPWVEVEARMELFGKDSAAELLSGNPDWVVDAIDNIDSKIELLVYCHENKIPVFAALGAASKSDPSRIQIADISTTFEDPLAKSVRRRLKLRGILSGIPVVYSTERPRPEIALLPLPDEEFEKGKVEELSAIANFRVRILPVLGPLPAMFGNAAAAYILNEIGGFKMEPLPVKDRIKMAGTIHRGLVAVESRLTGDNKIPLGEADVLYIFEEIHRARSVAPPFAIPTRPALLRWKKADGLAWDNLVIFDQGEGVRHVEHCLVGDEDPEMYWGPEVTALVARRTAEERRIRHYRL